MVILGIDPGTARAGYGLVEKNGSSYSLICCGILSNSPTHHTRLLEIRKNIISLVQEHKPTKVVVESLFFSNNKKTALSVAEARGVIIETLFEFNIQIIELTPNQIKSGITGNGNASKNAIKKMVSLFLKQDLNKIIDDSTDAIAAALLG